MIDSFVAEHIVGTKAFARRRELTVRMAVGAGRGRLIKQLLTESLLLAGIALVGAILVAHWSRNLLVLLIPPRSGPIFMQGELDWRVLALSAGVCLISILLFGMIPALQTSNLDISGALKCESMGQLHYRIGVVRIEVASRLVREKDRRTPRQQQLHRDRTTICMITHDPRFARHAERGINLFDGRIVTEPVETAEAG